MPAGCSVGSSRGSSAPTRVFPGPPETLFPARGCHNISRSFHAAHFQDAGKLAADMGHTSPAVVFQHYRERVEPEEAARYWVIRPVTASANGVAVLAASA